MKKEAMAGEYYVVVIFTPSRLLDEIVSGEVFLEFAYETSSDVDEKIRLDKLIEKTRDIFDKVCAYYGMKNNHDKRYQSTKKFYLKKWEPKNRQGWYALSMAFSMIGGIGGAQIEKGKPLSPQLATQINAIDKEILDLLHERRELK